ncbi:hypothetical protein PPL_01759 [Heterostelium album PN500]|uniref:Uncharacterized protein n=1 Tax=Heterostelium pallidum (strain ATCC 26659 / Pp 5 / PN500) TaxID=670386 RepID=D3B0E3_HETP5|nr:hypothetical protein PPL_01759 [Heterostelium album PN500]EFA84767.1 hypothetical protein PPL_01759 [Heterostelium album PN500]|eukprot:XP_020436879.1 hypothetical protein PPL_01759 [Heterostelium album PN500]
MSQNGVGVEMSKNIELDSSSSSSQQQQQQQQHQNPAQHDNSPDWQLPTILQPSPIMLSVNGGANTPSPKLPPLSLPPHSLNNYGWKGWISDTLSKNQRFHNMVYYRLGNLKYLSDTLAEPEP